MLRALHANEVVPAAQMKKSKSFDLDFLAGAYDFEPPRHFFGNRSGVEKFRIDLSLGDDGMLVLPAVFRRLDIMPANESM